MNGEIFEGSHPPIISKKLYDKVQSVFDKRANPTRTAQYSFAFRGYMRCGECGAMITAEKKKVRYIYYHCTKRITKCSQGCIEEKELAEQIASSLTQIWINDKTKDKILDDFEKHKSKEESTIENQITKTKKDLSAVTVQIDKLLDAYLSSIIDEKEYQAKKKILVERKADLKQNLANLQAGHSGWFELSKSVINTCNSVEKIINQKNFNDLSKIFQKTGSNFVLRDKKLFFSFQKPFDFIFLRNSGVLNSFRKKGALSLVPEGHAENFFKNVKNSQLNENWLPGEDSNLQQPDSESGVLTN